MKSENQTHLRPPPQDLCVQVLREKHAANPGELDADHIRQRVARIGKDEQQVNRFLQALRDGFVPGGRINRSAGTDLETTMINCFVQPIGDTMSGVDHEGLPGIMNALKEAAETMRRGGGEGYDFSRIRPYGARVKGTNSRASGPVSYMRVFDRMCETVESAGARRGAQMGILRVDHPDIEQFVDAKKVPDFEALGLSTREVAALKRMMQAHSDFAWATRKAFATLSNFNISVAVTDEFMNAVVADEEFDLVHAAEPAGDGIYAKKVCSDGVERYVYRTVRAVDIWMKIIRNTYEGAEPGIVFIDRANADNNLAYCERIDACNPCGEQFLPPYGCCDVGSPMLHHFVRNPFTRKAAFDFEAFKRCVAVGVELLDRVLDVTKWPLPQQQVEAMNKRRIGVGYLGLADAMAMLGIKYNSAQAVEFTRTVGTVLRDTAYRASIDLAKELGAFPYFNADEYLKEGTFASRLPDDIKADIRRHGIRNSHLLSLAPTGTIAMSFGDNAAGGLEPIFSKRQIRTKMEADGSRSETILDNAAYRLFKHLNGPDAESDVFVTAMDLKVADHLAILEAAAPLIDSGISKTVNVPAEYAFEDFADVYLRAWKAKLKGITTYRPNEMLGSVIADADAVVDAGQPATAVAADLLGDALRALGVEPAVIGGDADAAAMGYVEQLMCRLGVGGSASDLRQEDPDRRIELKDSSNVTSALRWPSRPVTPMGIESVTYSARHPQGDFAVIVGHIQNGKAHPVECYVAGNEQPRGLSAIAKVLSVDMRTGDAGWLKLKLDSLAGTVADDGFEMHDPATGNPIHVASLVAGFAKMVTHRLDSLGALTESGDSLMVNSLFSRREPKTGPMGSAGWTVDVYNPATGDDFLMTVKEARANDGSVRPYSVWLAGKYPRVLDGLTKLLSIDMRVSDPAWVLMKLRKLTNFGEQRGHFLAQVPGAQRQESYPSTVAYIATLLLERYRALGLGQTPLAETLQQAQLPLLVTSKGGTGMPCPNCHTNNLHRRDGCKSCDSCSYLGECG